MALTNLIPKRKGLIGDVPVVTPPDLFTFGSGTKVIEALKNANEVLRALQIFKGVYWFNNNWLPAGMIDNGVVDTGLVAWADDLVILSTGANSGGVAYVNKAARAFVEYVSIEVKPHYFGVCVTPQSITKQNIHLVCGVISDKTSPINSGIHIGFKCIDGVISGTVGDSANEATVILETLTVGGGDLILECIFRPTEGCVFYVNQVFKGRISATTAGFPITNPSVTTIGGMLNASIHSTEAANKILYIYTSRTLREE